MLVNLGSKLIGDGQTTYIVGEVGSNHNGSINIARQYIRALSEIGCNAVKFQSFTPQSLFNKRENENVYKILDKYKFEKEWHAELKQYADNCRIDFISTPFDEQYVDLLCEIGVDAIKIASGDITNIPLIQHIARTSKVIFLSTGMSTLGEVESALKCIRENGNSNVVLLQCVGLYPTEYRYANIKAMLTMQGAFQVPVGYSDHSEGDLVLLGAVANGACVIEKHVTFDRDEEGPDHFFAMTISEFEVMIDRIRNLEEAMGNGIKCPNEIEAREKHNARRGLIAQQRIAKGMMITREMIGIVRPEKGIEARYLDLVVGRVAKLDIESGDSILWTMI
ncbi:MAG: N-acetylneuraminate synthase family protein [Fermentimonas sp.]|nr:N-acetylneuraminate synthase family protein [Fermentimonas sp.]